MWFLYIATRISSRLDAASVLFITKPNHEIIIILILTTTLACMQEKSMQHAFKDSPLCRITDSFYWTAIYFKRIQLPLRKLILLLAFRFLQLSFLLVRRKQNTSQTNASNVCID